jgi:DNA-binding NarL/FixJ family response regulator
MSDRFADPSPASDLLPGRPDDEARGEAPRLLCVHEREPGWSWLTLGLDLAGLNPPRLVWVSTSREALTRLRQEPFDCIVVDVKPAGLSTGELGGTLELVRAIRTAGCDDPIVVVGRFLTEAEWDEASTLDCDVFAAHRGWDSPALAAAVKRAIARGETIRANRRLAAADHRRLLRERDESEQLLAHQKQIIAELESLGGSRSQGPPSGPDGERSHGGARGSEPPATLLAAYEALLRSYVLMGTGSLAAEIAAFADQVRAAGLSSTEALQVHVRSVEELVQGLGNRSARHVVARADLLAVELMTRLADQSPRASTRQNPPAILAVPSPLRNVSDAAGIDLTETDRNA